MDKDFEVVVIDHETGEELKTYKVMANNKDEAYAAVLESPQYRKELTKRLIIVKHIEEIYNNED